MYFTQYGLLAGLAIAAMLPVTFLAGFRRGAGYGSVIRFAVLALPLSFLLSRAIYCLCTIDYYTEITGRYLELMLEVRDGGYSMLGAMLGVILAALLAERWQKLPAGTMLDAAAVGMPFALIIARLAEPLCSTSYTEIGCGRALPSQHPDCFDFLYELCDGGHPVFAYEAVAAALILIALLVIRRRARRGDVFLSFLLLFGCSQTVLESMLDTDHMKFLFVHITQVAALVMALLPLILWSIRYPRSDRGAKLRIGAAWTLAIAGIIAALIQEISVEGADRLETIEVYIPFVLGTCLGAGLLFWCAAWCRKGILRLIPAVVAGALTIAAVIISSEPESDPDKLILWGIMALGMFLLCWTALTLRTPAPANINE